MLRAELAAQRGSRQTHRPEPGDEHGVVAADSNFFDGFVNRPESTGDLCAVGIGKLVGQGNQVFLFRDHVVCHPAVALPSVGAPVSFAGAGNHVAAAAVVADSTAGNVVHNNAIADAKTPAAGAGLHDLTAGLMARDYALISFRAFAQMLVIDAADIRATDG